jgi:hypothetical protein
MKTLTTEKRKEYAGPALRIFFNICQAWGLNNHQMQSLLGLSTESTFYNWKKNPVQVNLSNDVLERLSYIFGIYKALQILLPNPAIADSWINLPSNHPQFNGKKPIDRMLSGQVADLYEVRRYLDAERGGW